MLNILGKEEIMNDFDRHISLIRALKRLQPNHKKIYSIFTDITPADVYFFMTIYHTINGSEFHSFSVFRNETCKRK